ncbi:serine hydrolase domain-containing protein [Streptomyces fuscigenes]|uniref:serine hydrolase domain-containing protein n=1 Tax=Streptomyces fuscigenes TaxID=1528880 RepID=UPI001F18B4B0|nr:serine hydrolase domain-containing protein [Streptomyces fuscigenes]MCF3961296.1 beta-lactamase family protein [Streptomyces fuscigenes]
MTSSLETDPAAGDLLPTTRRALLHRVAVGQSQGRAPSLVGAVARDGHLVWEGGRGSLDGHPPDAATQFRIGSITKTFTAVLVMRLRDEGLLDLADPLEKHLPGTGAGELTLAQLLAHSSGLRAEPPGAWWERVPGTLRPKIPDILGDEPLLHPAGRRHHYSNPGYALLGAVVEQLRGKPWAQALREEVLVPLSLGRTTAEPVAPRAEGWAVHPWADAMLPEPPQDLGVMAPAGQLWSTARDLCRFGGFLLRGDDRVLSAETVAEMRRPSAPPEPDDWAGGYGLGLQLAQRGRLSLLGHTGSLPGFLACLWANAEEGLVGVALANATSGPAIGGIAADLVTLVADAEPRLPEPWRPMEAFDQGLLEIAGQWYWGTNAYGLKLVSDGGVELYPLSGNGRGSRFVVEEGGGGEGGRPAVDPSRRGLDGYYAGETLRVVRRADGSVSHLDLGTFVLTRQPYDPVDVVPGGVDAEGWR